MTKKSVFFFQNFYIKKKGIFTQNSKNYYNKIFYYLIKIRLKTFHNKCSKSIGGIIFLIKYKSK